MNTVSVNQPTLMEQVLSDPKYKGKHVVIVEGQIFTANTGDGARRILEHARKEYPHTVPAVTYIPDADTLILVWW